MHKTAVLCLQIFFYKAQVVSEGELKPGTEYKDYLWLTRDELSFKLYPDYYKQICEFLINESN